MLKLFTIFTLTVLFLTSCKDKKTTFYNIKGRFINACDNSPLANLEIELAQAKPKRGLFRNRNTYAYVKTTTDANGEFSIYYETSTTYPALTLNEIDSIPVQDLNLGNIPYYKSSSVYYKVKVNNSHTANDTLLFYDLVNTTIAYKMNGPLHDTVLGIRTIKQPNLTMYYKHELGKVIYTDTTLFLDTYYKINRAYKYANTSAKNVSACNAVADTFVLYIN